MAEGVPARLSREELRKFGLTVGAAFGVIAAIAWWRGHPLSTQVLGGLAAVLVIGGAVVPALLAPVYSAWMGFAKILSKITTPIFLGIVYFLIFTPVGVLRRLLGKDQLDRKPVDGSFYVNRRARPVGSMDRLF